MIVRAIDAALGIVDAEDSCIDIDSIRSERSYGRIVQSGIRRAPAQARVGGAKNTRICPNENVRFVDKNMVDESTLKTCHLNPLPQGTRWHQREKDCQVKETEAFLHEDLLVLSSDCFGYFTTI